VYVIKHEGLLVSEDTYEDRNGARFASFFLNGMEDDALVVALDWEQGLESRPKIKWNRKCGDNCGIEFHQARAAGPGGYTDFSTWLYVYSEKNHLIVNGTIDLTAKMLCSVDNNFNLTRYN
jgi:hypothetical protein